MSGGLGDALAVLHCLGDLAYGALTLECWVLALWLGARPGSE